MAGDFVGGEGEEEEEVINCTARVLQLLRHWRIDDYDDNATVEHEKCIKGLLQF